MQVGCLAICQVISTASRPHPESKANGIIFPSIQLKLVMICCAATKNYHVAWCPMQILCACGDHKTPQRDLKSIQHKWPGTLKSCVNHLACQRCGTVTVYQLIHCQMYGFFGSGQGQAHLSYLLLNLCQVLGGLTIATGREYLQLCQSLSPR